MMYPKEYDRFLPIADQVINDMQNQFGNEDIYLDTDTLNQMAEEAVRRSKNNMQDMHDMHDNIYDENDGYSVPTFNSGHSSSALTDIYKILLLQRLLGGPYFVGPRPRRHGGRRPGHGHRPGGGRPGHGHGGRPGRR